MKDLFVNGKNVILPLPAAVAGTWETIDLTAPEDTTKGLFLGQLGFFEADGNSEGKLLVLAGTGTKSEAIKIGTRLPGGAVKYSTPIYKNSKVSEVQPYVAPKGTTKSLGASKDGTVPAGTTPANGSLNLPSTFKTGSTLQFSIRDLSKEMHDETAIEIYSTVVKSGDSQDSVIRRLAEQVNDNDVSCVMITVDVNGVILPSNLPTLKITAGTPAVITTVIDGIVFTSKVVGNDFSIMLLSGLLQDADLLESNMKNGKIITTPPPASPTPDGLIAVEKGQGTYAQMLQAEKVASTRDGATHTQVLTKYMGGPDSLIDSTVEYAQLVVSHITPRSDEIMRENNPMQSLMIIGNNTVVGQVKTLLDAFIVS